MNCFHHRLPLLRRIHRSEAAFTLVDLLVILAVLGVLVLLSFPALARSQGQTKIAQCAGNLRQLALAIHNYANENNQRLPTASGGSWAWDLPGSARSSLLTAGAQRQNFYCPGFPDQNSDSLWNYALPGYVVIGYVLALPGGASLISSNQNATLTPPYLRVGSSSFPPQSAASRVLVADVTVSQQGQNQTSQKYNYSYFGVLGGWAKPHRTSHMGIRYPAGGNQVMLDSHVEWRQFQDMQCRTSGGVPGFWW